jgi:hypothetical protein
MCYQLDWVVAVGTLERWKVNKRSFWLCLVWRVNFNVVLFPSTFAFSLSLSLTFRVRTPHIWIIFISSLSMPAAFSSSCSSLRHTYCNRENDKYWIHHPKVLNDNNGKHVTVLRQNVLFNGPYMSSGKSFHPFLILLFFLSCLIRSKTQVAPFPCL